MDTTRASPPPFQSQPDTSTTDVTDKLVLEEETLANLIKARPAAAVGVALLVGFIVGRVAARF